MTTSDQTPSMIWLSFLEGYRAACEVFDENANAANLELLEQRYAMWLAQPDAQTTLAQDMSDISALLNPPKSQAETNAELMMSAVEAFKTSIAGIEGMVRQAMDSGWPEPMARELVLALFVGAKR